MHFKNINFYHIFHIILALKIGLCGLVLIILKLVLIEFYVVFGDEWLDIFWMRMPDKLE
jgi:hypothetical protein